uniref:Uncharacterized protein n=1 Tax=Arundo donax TaxID=35708 RepID=A0A0A8ZNG6_ARUDO
MNTIREKILLSEICNAVCYKS